MKTIEKVKAVKLSPAKAEWMCFSVGLRPLQEERVIPFGVTQQSLIQELTGKMSQTNSLWGEGLVYQ